jgi:hypothetical protein
MKYSNHALSLHMSCKNFPCLSPTPNWTELNWTQRHIATDGQSVCKSWCRAPSGPHGQVFITVWELRSCFCGAPSLTRRRICLLHMFLALDSAVFVWTESRGTRDHIVLTQIWNFPFRRHLRLAGSRWRYSIPPPLNCWRYSRCIASARTTHRKPSSIVA